MTPVTSLLTALERHDIAALNDLLDHEGITDEHFTCDEAAALWDAGWHVWLGGGRNGHASWQAGEAWDELRHEPWGCQVKCVTFFIPAPAPRTESQTD